MAQVRIWVHAVWVCANVGLRQRFVYDVMPVRMIDVLGSVARPPMNQGVTGW
jgi:hypothetical protein